MAENKDIRICIETVTYEVEASLFGEEEIDVLSEEDIRAALEPDKIEMRTLGTLTEDAERVEIRYEESEATGMEGSVTRVFFETREAGLVTMMRTGAVSTALVFEKGKRHHCIYKTPFMPFEICVNTLDVQNRITEDGVLLLDYIIEIRGAKAERTKFVMKIMK